MNDGNHVNEIELTDSSLPEEHLVLQPADAQKSVTNSASKKYGPTGRVRGCRTMATLGHRYRSWPVYNNGAVIAQSSGVRG